MNSLKRIMLLLIGLSLLVDIKLLLTHANIDNDYEETIAKGIDAYCQRDFMKAARLFSNAIALNSNSLPARKYYATALFTEYFKSVIVIVAPKVDPAEDWTLAHKIIGAYQDVIDISKDPKEIDTAYENMAASYSKLGETET